MCVAFVYWALWFTSLYIYIDIIRDMYLSSVLLLHIFGLLLVIQNHFPPPSSPGIRPKSVPVQRGTRGTFSQH